MKKTDIFISKFKGNIRSKFLELILTKEISKATELLVYNILSEFKIITTREDTEPDIYIYRDGIYIPKGKTYIEQWMREVTGMVYCSYYLNLVISKIRADTYLDPEIFFRNINLYEIPLLNGVLDTRTRVLRDYDQEKDIFFYKMPVRYDPKADCPNIDKHFQDVLKNPSDKTVLYELIGYCLDRTHFIEKAFMFVGDGRNGKGKTLELLKRFVGAEGCASVPLSSMKEDSFNLHQLHGKAVNMAGDLNNTDLKNTGLFKSITGRDLITAHRKFKTDLIFVSTCKNIFACNELPKVYDLSKGFWSRWVLLEFPYEFIKQDDYDKFTDEERKYKKIIDPEHIDKIVSDSELSGLLNRALDGLDRLRKNKDFSYTVGTDEIKNLWIRRANSFTAFCYDCVIESEESYVTKSELRKHFNKYRNEFNLKGAGDKEIKATLEDLYGVGEGRKEILDEWVNIWTGIELKDFQGYQGKTTYRRGDDLSRNSKNGGNPNNSNNPTVVLCNYCKSSNIHEYGDNIFCNECKKRGVKP